MSALWVSVPDKVEVSSASNVPPVIATLEARVPVLSNFNEPAVTLIAPDNVLFVLIDTGVSCPIVRVLTVEFASTSIPSLAIEVLALSSVIESSTSLLSALSRVIPPLVNVPPPVKVIVFAPTPIAVPE